MTEERGSISKETFRKYKLHITVSKANVQVVCFFYTCSMPRLIHDPLYERYM